MVIHQNLTLFLISPQMRRQSHRLPMTWTLGMTMFHRQREIKTMRTMMETRMWMMQKRQALNRMMTKKMLNKTILRKPISELPIHSFHFQVWESKLQVVPHDGSGFRFQIRYQLGCSRQSLVNDALRCKG